MIRALGLINARVQEDHAVYGIKPSPRHVDLPYPGVFVLDRDGVVRDKRFYESYREREAGGGLIAQALGIITPPATPVVGTDGPEVGARAWLDSPTYAFFQRLALTVEVAVAPGRTPPSVEIEPIDGLEVGPTRWSPAGPIDGPGAGAGPRVHEGLVRGTIPLTFSAPPGGGDHVLGVTVRYQAGGEATGRGPSSIRLEVPVREAPLVGRSLPPPAATA